MARVNLLGGTYIARSIIASAQTCLNLYPEKNPQDASAPYTNQLTPGLTLKKIVPTAGVARGMYTATNGNLYYVCGNTLYFIDSNFNISALGNLNDGLTTPVAMQDNGNVLIITNGQASVGWAVNLQANIAGRPLGGFFTNTGTGGTSGTYTNVPLTGGSGAGATAASITVSGGAIISFTLGSTGGGYALNDVLTTTVGGLAGVALKLNEIGALVNAFAAINDPNFLGSVGIGFVDTFLGFNQPGTRNFYTSLSNVTFAELTGAPGSVMLLAVLATGSGGVNGTYNNAPFVGGSGAGGTANVTVAGGAVSLIVVQTPGLAYSPGDVFTFSTAGIPSNAQFEIVQTNAPAFDPTYIAGKTGYPDLLATIIAVHREWWLLGAFESAEVWYDAGGATFPFAIMPGVFIQHGCIAPYSAQTHDLVTFWLGIDSAGLGTVFMGSGYAARRISTFAIEQFISDYLKSAGTIADAIGMVYKQQDHIFYALTFPSADATLVYDLTEGLWHERGWTDPASGTLHRIRANCMALAYNVNVCADWQNGNIYTLDLSAYDDAGAPIVRRRGLPHLLNDGKRAVYERFALDMECGNGLPSDPTYQPQVLLEISDDRGRTFRALPMQSLGAQGQYLVQPVWHRLGLARDRVFRVTWSEAVFTALQGAWLDTTPSES